MSSKIEPSIGKENLEPRKIIEETSVQSIQEVITAVKEDYQKWNTSTFPWFRGEPANPPESLLPRLFRGDVNKGIQRENILLQNFRMKAPSLGLKNTPQRDHTDEWLFLAQHVGLPTRLLDWTEGLFIALFFALKESSPAIWMLDPAELNNKSLNKPMKGNEYGLTWFNRAQLPLNKEEYLYAQLLLLDESLGETDKDKVGRSQKLIELFNLRNNISSANIRGTWEKDKPSMELPVAIHPTYVHERMHTQKSRFTVHGKKKQSISNLVDSRVLRKYVIPSSNKETFTSDLHMIGFTNTSVYPDLDNLAMELTETYK